MLDCRVSEDGWAVDSRESTVVWYWVMLSASGVGPPLSFDCSVHLRLESATSGSGDLVESLY